MNKPVVVIQARMGSTRLPGKVLKPIVGKPMLWHIVQRARWIEGVTNVVVATSEQQQDQPIRDFCLKHEIAFTAGSESDVLERFYQAAVQCGGDPLIRITADCPFIDPEVVTRLLQLYETGQYDHVGVAAGAGAIFMKDHRFPNGLDAECFSLDALEQAWYEAQEPDEREHVTPFMWRQPQRFRLGHLTCSKDYSHLRWTVDLAADFEFVSRIYAALYRDEKPFSMQDILHYLDQNPEIVSLSSDIDDALYEQLWHRAATKSTAPA